MNERIKKKWIEALRSGKYKQGTGKLKGSDEFCCMGVLCDLHAKETGNKFIKINDREVYLGRTGVLPEEVIKWSGISNSSAYFDPEQNYDGYATSLIELNDDGKTFKQIADIIEKYF